MAPTTASPPRGMMKCLEETYVYQIIRKKNAMRLRMVLLLVVIMIIPFCLAGCRSEKKQESKTESGEKESKTESGEVTASGRGLKVAVVNVGVEIKGKSGIEILAEEYNKTPPDTPMTLVTFGEGNTISMDVAMAKLSAEIAGDDPPDLIFLQKTSCIIIASWYSLPSYSQSTILAVDLYPTDLNRLIDASLVMSIKANN